MSDELRQGKYNVLENLHRRKLITSPSWVPGATKYLTIMGSVAYGVSSDTSDTDVYGFCIPRKDIIFPHTIGCIPNYDQPPEKFDEYQQVGVLDPSALAGKGRNYDIFIYSIIKYFKLCEDGNPNMIDSLFTPNNCVLINGPVAQLVRDNRRLFLSKRCWQRFKGYAYSQINKMRNNNPTGKRKELIEKYGYDTKFAYHLVRLMSECEQILTEGDIDLQKNREQLKDVRNGNWSMEEVETYFVAKEKYLEEVYLKSELPQNPDHDKIRKLLLECLAMEYGSIGDAIIEPTSAEKTLDEVYRLVEQFRKTR